MTSADEANPDRPFRRLSRTDSSSWDRDRNQYGRDEFRASSDRVFGGGSYRDPERDALDAQRMDDEGGAQDFRRSRVDPRGGQSQNDPSRAYDRSPYGRGYGRSYDRDLTNDGFQARDLDRGGERYPQRNDAHQRDDRGERVNRSARKRWWQSEGATVADVMTKDVKTVTPDATMREIAEIMRKEDVGVVPVVRDDGRLHGLVTDRDIVVRCVAGGKTVEESRANDVATTDIEVASPQDSLSQIIDLMGRQQIRRVPVVDDRDRLVGIVSLGDIANRADQDQELQDAFEKISGRRSFWSRIWR
jgi:CBS domain-containing protein